MCLGGHECFLAYEWSMEVYLAVLSSCTFWGDNCTGRSSAVGLLDVHYGEFYA